VGKLLMLAGVVLLVAGALLTWGPALPGLSSLGRLPGDLRIERPGFRLYVPLTSSILVSVVLTLLLRWVARK
jgi:hypothetical protein